MNRALRPSGNALARLAVLLLLGVACASVEPPQSRVITPIDPSVPEKLYVVAHEERERVNTSLRNAGFAIAGDPRDTPATLYVKLGKSRASRECGWVRNIVYDLRLDGVRVAVIKARGWTGACKPSSLDATSKELMRIFEG